MNSRPHYRQARWDEPLISKLETGDDLEPLPKGLVPEGMERKLLRLPNLPELRVMRHFTRLSQMNFGVESGTYPLGSCTMKYNPKISEKLANLPGFTDLHPNQSEDQIQGALKVIYDLQEWLAQLTGMSQVSLHPAAGSQGEFASILMIKKYHEENNEENRDEVIVPDSAHGTNPSSSAMGGYKVIELCSKEDGLVDLEALEAALTNNTAAFMLTNPNTLGLFESDILEISELVHNAGAILYYDGANLNSIVGRITPGEMGFDLVHLNLHKTFSTPHGGGGPGAGPIGAVEKLEKYLPEPIVKKTDIRYEWDKERRNSIGTMIGTPTSFGVMVRAYTYLRMLGIEGLREVSKQAVLNANYLKSKLEKIHGLKTFPQPCMHEFVLDAAQVKRDTGIGIFDLSKALLDYGIHAPTMYFPKLRNLSEHALVEPTETETKQELDAFIKAFRYSVRLAYADPDYLRQAPHNLAVGRINLSKSERGLYQRLKER